MLAPESACTGERLIRDMATTLVVLRSPPTTTKDRPKWKLVELRLATINGTQTLLHGHVSFEGAKIPLSPRFGFSVCSRRYLETKCLERETELLVVDEENLVGICPWVEVIPSKQPIRKSSTFRLMKPRNVLSDGVNHGD